MIASSCENALIVTACKQTTRQILGILAEKGICGAVADQCTQAASRLASGTFAMVLVDMDACGDEAFKLVATARGARPEMPVVMLSGDDDVKQAVKAMQGGCRDYLTKPMSDNVLGELIDQLVPNHHVSLAASGPVDCGYRLAGKSPLLMETIRLAGRVAATSAPVLLTGESGTGKELISRLVQQQSHRRDAAFIRVNCASFSESLLESELFGHERGAFTGAMNCRKGCFEQADGGTLLLDEISETTPRFQSHLLRVLEEQDFCRVGGSERVSVNVRIISTSNLDLAAEIRSGRFRSDLYYRLSSVHLTVPPLRHRLEDIKPLVLHFVNMFAAESGRTISELDNEMLEDFQRRPWPGNIRQLRNVVRSALILGEGSKLTLADCNLALSQMSSTEDMCEMPLRLGDLERRAILEALRRTKSHQARAARLLGITDRTLREKLRRYKQEEVEAGVM